MMGLYIAGGFLLLLVGGELLVHGSVALARRLHVTPFLIGLTVVAYGTSAPELVVSLGAALKDAPDLAVGNVVGSNIANILLVLGFGAVIASVKSNRRVLSRDLPALMGAALLFIVFAQNGVIVAWHGGVMVLALAGLSAYSYIDERRHHARSAASGNDEEEGLYRPPKPLGLALLFVGLGLVAVIAGAGLLIDGSVALAHTLGVSEAVIGLTVLALGSSLPELATTIVAAYRRHGEIAFGNILGSCIFNILGVIGLVAIVLPLPVAARLRAFDLWVMLGVLALPLVIALFDWRIPRPGGFLFLAGYAGYVYLQYAVL